MKTEPFAMHYDKLTEFFATEYHNLIRTIDEVLQSFNVQLHNRPYRVTVLLQSEGLVKLVNRGEGASLMPTVDIKTEKFSPEFRFLFDSVEYWYRSHYGEAAIRKVLDNDYILGAVRISGSMFALNIPNFQKTLVREAEVIELKMNVGIGSDENPIEWIQNAPRLENLSKAYFDEAAEQTRAVSENLRIASFFRIPNREIELAANEMFANVIPNLEIVATYIAFPRNHTFGVAWNALQLANESLLKGVIAAETGRYPFIHDLSKLLNLAHDAGLIYDASNFVAWPDFSKKVSHWRYNQESPKQLDDLYDYYRLSLELVRATLHALRISPETGFALELQFKPWSAKNAAGELRIDALNEVASK